LIGFSIQFDRFDVGSLSLNLIAFFCRAVLASSILDVRVALRANELLALRQIKNRLAVLIPLVRDQKLPPNAELQGWLALKDHLP